MITSYIMHFIFWLFTSLDVIKGQRIQENMAAPQWHLNERQKLSMAKTSSPYVPMAKTTLEVYFHIAPFFSLYFCA